MTEEKTTETVTKPTTATTETTAAPIVPAKPEKVLIADDSAFMRKILINILSKGGYTNVVEAVDGNEAIEKCGTENPDMLLLDIIMPGVDGLGVMKKIDTSKIKVVMVTAVGQDKMMEESTKLGAKSYVVKPFDEVKVLEAVNNALSGAAAPAEGAAETAKPITTEATAPKA